jgi:PPOX class probable F420-dependent enzyme
MDLDAAIRFAAARREGVLVTVRRDGRPQLSNVLYSVGGARDEGAGRDTVRISVTDTRAKTRNLRRDPRASLYVVGETFWSYVVLDGTAELTPVATDPHDAVVDELVLMYQGLRGEHPDWDGYRRAMVADHRLVVRFRPERAYGILAAE